MTDTLRYASMAASVKGLAADLDAVHDARAGDLEEAGEVLSDLARRAARGENPLTMSPAEHYTEAERIVAKYREVNDAVSTKEATADLVEAMGADAAKQFVMDLLPGMALMLQEAQVHATLATAPAHWGSPVIVSAPADLIDRIKIVDPGDSTRGVLFIPEEMVGTESGDITEKLIDAMSRPLDATEGNRS